MTSKKTKHGKIFDEVLKRIDKRITKIRDAKRGYPESRINEVQALKDEIYRIIIEANPDVKKPLKRLQEICEEGISEMRENSRILPDDPEYRPVFLSDRYVLTAPKTHTRPMFTDDVDLPTIPRTPPMLLNFNGAFSVGFENAGRPREMMNGLFGWGLSSESIPYIINTPGDGVSTKTGRLDFKWDATIPYDGVFTLNPYDALYAEIHFYYQISGDIDNPNGIWGRDASVEINGYSLISLGSELIDEKHIEVFYDQTSAESKSGEGFGELHAPAAVTFEAIEGQLLSMILRLEVATWTNNRGYSRVDIWDFAIPINEMSDLDIAIIE